MPPAERERDDNYSMRTSAQDRKDWAEGAALLTAQMGIKVTVSDFLRLAARDKLEELKKGKKAGR